MQPLKTSSVVVAMGSSNPALVTIKLTKGEKAAMTLLTAIISNGLKYFNVGKGMTPEQMVLTAELIQAEYHYFKPDEVAMAFRLAATGKFGTIYDRLDSAIIMQWMAEYNALRMMEAENMSIKASKKPDIETKIESSVNIPPDIKEAFKRLYSETEKKVEPKKERPKNDEMVQAWLRQFDKIAMLQNVKGQIKIIKRYGRMMDVSEFLNYKINQLNQFKP